MAIRIAVLAGDSELVPTPVQVGRFDREEPVDASSGGVASTHPPEFHDPDDRSRHQDPHARSSIRSSVDQVSAN